LRTISLTKKIENKKDKNGKCFKKLRQQFGKRARLITIRNGTILLKTLRKKFKKSQFYQKMIQILEPYKWISRKERKREPKIHKKQRI